MANSKTFYKWLISQRNRDDVVGDIALDVKRDGNFPKSAPLSEMVEYLNRISASRDVIDALKEAHQEFEALSD